MKRILIIFTVLAVLFSIVPAAFCGDKAVTMGTRSYYDILDEDAMGSDSATAIPTQQSVKAYVDNTVDRVKRTAIPLGSVFVDAVGPITSSSAPNLTTVDNVGAIVYDDSDETAEIQFEWAPEADWNGTFTIDVIATSSGAAGSEQAIDWTIYVYDDGATTIPTAVAQTGAAFTSTSMDGSPDKATLTLDDTGKAAITAGTSLVKVAIFNAGTSSNTLEIKGITTNESLDL